MIIYLRPLNYDYTIKQSKQSKLRKNNIGVFNTFYPLWTMNLSIKHHT